MNNEWLLQDGPELYKFLSSATGMRLINKLKNDRPELHAENIGNLLESYALAANKAIGWEQCIDLLISLAVNRINENDRSFAGYVRTDID